MRDGASRTWPRFPEQVKALVWPCYAAKPSMITTSRRHEASLVWRPGDMSTDRDRNQLANVPVRWIGALHLIPYQAVEAFVRSHMEAA